MCPRCKSRLWNVPKLRAPPRHPGGLGIDEVITPHRRELARLRRKYGVATLRVFGSVARGEAGPNSDVDLLVEYSRAVDILTGVSLRLDLQAALGRRVDLVREEYLKWSVRPQALADAVPV
jgi:hypothetical protein